MMPRSHLYQIPATDCPYCGHRLFLARGRLADTKPADGDPGVCNRCGGILIHRNGQIARITPSDEDRLALLCPRILAAVRERSRQVARAYEREQARNN
jgi:hypothetical protein